MNRGDGPIPALTITNDRRANVLFAIVDEHVQTELKMRVRRLLSDLVNDDLPMALLDLAQLHRAVAAMRPENVDRARSSLEAGLVQYEMDR